MENLYKVNELSKISNVSIRTLHYYDKINLLKPIKINSKGYRFYDNSSLFQLQQILLFRELGFTLKEIKIILNSNIYDYKKALVNQKEIIIKQKQRLENLITLLDGLIKGEKNMSFKEFDLSKIEEAKEKYKDEVKDKWGNTEAYKQSTQRVKNYTKEDWKKIQKESDAIFKAFANSLDLDPGTKEVQLLVKKWQDFINQYYYDCDNEILKGLGSLYINDERFTKNIDKYKKGTALFISKAIEIYTN